MLKIHNFYRTLRVVEILLTVLCYLTILTYFLGTYLFIDKHYTTLVQFLDLNYIKDNLDHLYFILKLYLPILGISLLCLIMFKLLKTCWLSLNVNKVLLNDSNLDPILGRYLVNHFRVNYNISYKDFAYIYSLARKERYIVENHCISGKLDNLFNKFDMYYPEDKKVNEKYRTY